MADYVDMTEREEQEMESLKGIRYAVQNIPLYVPGKPIEEIMRDLGLSRVIKLGSNENSIGPSPLAVQAILDHVWDIHRYPEDTNHDLKVALAKHLNVDFTEVLLGQERMKSCSYYASSFSILATKLPTPFLLFPCIGRLCV